VAALRDISALGVMSVSLTGMVALALFGALLATTTEEYRPILMTMWYPALGLFGSAIGAEVLRCAGLLKPGKLLTWLQGSISLAVPVALGLAVVWHGDFVEAKVTEVRCVKERAAEVEQTDRQQTGTRAALKKCKQDFEDSKSVFTTTTVETACRSAQRAFDAAAQAYKSASDRICAPAATGALH